MLATRLLTALVAIPLIVAIILIGKDIGVLVLVLFISGVGLYEYLSFLYPEKLNVQMVVHILLGLTIPLAFFFGFPEMVVPTITFVFVSVTAFSLFRVTDPEKKAENLFIRMFGIFYVAFLLSYLIVLCKVDVELGPRWVLIAICINFGTDAGGYFAGSFLGKHKLYPAVSPKKTVEGAIGGVFTCILVLVGCKYVFFNQLGFWDILAIGLGGSLLAILGDMVESLIKRGFKVKDAGGIVPGHGGVLDRIDSYVFSTPFIYYYVTLCFVP